MRCTREVRRRTCAFEPNRLQARARARLREATQETHTRARARARNRSDHFNRKCHRVATSSLLHDTGTMRPLRAANPTLRASRLCHPTSFQTPYMVRPPQPLRLALPRSANGQAYFRRAELKLVLENESVARQMRLACLLKQ